jgi:hypothetical protein
MQLNLPHRGHQGNWTYKEKEIYKYNTNTNMKSSILY